MDLHLNPQSTIHYSQSFVCIGLGSNQGNRKAHLQQAIEELHSFCSHPNSWKVSQFYETHPVDCAPGTAMFLNAAVGFLTTCPPFELIRHCRAIETQHGRPQNYKKNAPRSLDLDLLIYDKLTLFSPNLKIPHPQITRRLFVLICLKDICPHDVIPGQTQTIQELYENVIRYN